MRRYVFLALLLLIGLSKTDAQVANLSDYNAILTSPPKLVPTQKTPDGAVAGNGDLGITLGGTPDKLTFYIGKNDFWYSFPSYPMGGIAFPGGVDIDIESLRGASYRVEQRPHTADILGTFKNGETSVEIKAFVAATRNRIVFEIKSDKQCVMNLRLWTPEGNNSQNGHGSHDNIYWVSRTVGNTPEAAWPCTVAMAADSPLGEIVLAPDKTFTLTVVAYTSFDRSRPLDAAVAEARSVTPADTERVRTEHRRWWDDYRALSNVKIDDKELEKYYHVSQYLFACSSREGKFAPGIWGSFVMRDNTSWGGDYHLNYNYQAPYWASYSSNHISLTDNFDAPLLEYMDAGRVHASKLLSCRGIYYPVGIGPRGYCSTRWPLTPELMEASYSSRDNTLDDGYKFLGQKINAVFSVGNMLMRFYSTYDADYARKVYPYLLACADFWEDYLQLEDDRYVIRDDHFNEVYPNHRNGGNWKPQWGDFNSTLSLGLVNMLFRGIIDMSNYIGCDSDRQTKWNDILNRMSRYPVGLNPDGYQALKSMERGPGGKDVEARGLNRVSIHGIILPGGVCGQVTDSAFNAILLNDVARWKDQKTVAGGWGNTLGNGIETVFPGAVRVGYNPEIILAELKERISAQVYPNLWIYQAGGGIETLAAVPLTINEMLMQSYEGMVRIFPNWNRRRDASFDNLRAYGAFLVSSSLSGGKIDRVVIKSEMGRPLKIENPWGGKVSVIRSNGANLELEGRVLQVDTAPGETIVLRPM